ncbi:hypothetical protein TNCT_596871 [Trichonephila clavata]|uniref:Uncharacterized protein n=1 Tax=Trichonephila clavata TaxID=2740835 RepID=A0A8X6G9D6_TRICU|nr:hypothetical protein TNCT_596871 [Trichonephila clavata]
MNLTYESQGACFLGKYFNPNSEPPPGLCSRRKKECTRHFVKTPDSLGGQVACCRLTSMMGFKTTRKDHSCKDLRFLVLCCNFRDVDL